MICELFSVRSFTLLRLCTDTMRQQLPIGLLLKFLCCLSCMSHAQDSFPIIKNSEKDTAAQPMAAQEAVAGMVVPEGFKVTLFASEPEVQNPIAQAWDSRGRLWIAENFTYAEREQRFDLSFRDRVLVFSDDDNDGVADSRKVFTDQVQMLTSVEVGRGGVWLMCPPQLLFIPDADGDLVPDGPAQVILDGFHVPQANYHNYANGLRFGPDGWLYGRCGGSCPGRLGAPGTSDDERFALEGGIWRYHPLRKTVEVLTSGTTNPWGHDWNEFGELFFINTVNGHFWHAVQGAHFNRPFNLDPNAMTYETIDTHADHYHFDTGKSWVDSRDGAANALGGGHAHCGAMFYLGNGWPREYHGKFFTLNYHGRRMNQETVQRVGSGYVASHNDDFCIASDPFFRGMDLSVGPDGGVFVIDWSDTGECHDHTGVHRTSGRIFKITHASSEAMRLDRDVATLSTPELVELHANSTELSSNEWALRQARLVLASRVGTSDQRDDLRRALEPLVEKGNDLVATRAAMTLIACGCVDSNVATRWLSHSCENVRVWAIRSLFEHMPIDDDYGPRKPVSNIEATLYNRCKELARTDPSGLVRLAFASTLQRIPVAHRAELATVLMQRAEDADDHNLPLLVWYGLMPVADTNMLALVDVAMHSKWPKTQRLITRRIAESLHEDADSLDSLVSQVAALKDPVMRRNLLAGVADAMKGWARAPQPKAWGTLVNSVGDDEPELANLLRELSVVFGDGRAIEEVRALVLDNNAAISLRRSALASLVTQRPPDLQEICTKLLGDQRLSNIAAKGLALSDEPEMARLLIKNYGKFRGTDRPGIIASLVSRKSFAAELVEAIDRGEIARNELTAYDARQIRSLGDDVLNKRLGDVWGEFRESPDDRKAAMQKVKDILQSVSDGPVDLSDGRRVFANLCAKCHRMYGEGQQIGPDLTGSNRDNLDYLLENIVDPSAVVAKDYRVSVLMLHDGRILNGVVLSRNKRSVTIQTQTERVILQATDIEDEKLTSSSPMPDGQLDALTVPEIRNLFHYLQHPVQVALPTK